MKLDTEKLKLAGTNILQLEEEVISDPTAEAFLRGQDGLVGLSITGEMATTCQVYKDYLVRFGAELDYFGNALQAAATMIDATDEQGGDSIRALDIHA